jgi:hypothetical protein
MQDNYTLKKRIDQRVALALAYSKALQVVKTKMIKDKIILMNN